jgi:hypothetical protein
MISLRDPFGLDKGGLLSEQAPKADKAGGGSVAAAGVRFK